MPTATVHIQDVAGFAGPARTFKLDPPLNIGGIDREYVTAWAQAGYGQFTRPEVCVVPAEVTGAAAPLLPGSPASLMRHPGSFVLHDDPDTTERIDGAYWLAMQLLGGYEITPTTDAAP